MAVLEKRDFDAFIRMARNVSIENVHYLRDASFRNLRRIRKPRDLEYAATSTPRGSDQVDTGAVVAWMASVQKDEPEAVKQLVALDATLVNRC